MGLPSAAGSKLLGFQNLLGHPGSHKFPGVQFRLHDSQCRGQGCWHANSHGVCPQGQGSPALGRLTPSATPPLSFLLLCLPIEFCLMNITS